MEAVIDAPVRSIEDLRAKLDYLMSMPDGDESFGDIDDRLTRFMQAILAGGIVCRQSVQGAAT